MIFDRLLALPDDAEPWIVDHEPIILTAHDEKVPPAAIADAAARTATALKANGVTARSRCVVWLETPADVIVAYAAITALDAVPILISPTLDGDTLRAMVADVADISAVVTADDRVAECRALLPDHRVLDWRRIAAELPSHARFTREPEVATHATYVVVHTSGTTGVPKLVECSGRSIRFNSWVQAGLQACMRLRGHMAFAISPVHGRTVVGVYGALIRRVPLLLLSDVSPDNVARMLTRHRPIFLETHPNTFRAWQHLADRGAFRSVRFFGASFDVIHPDTIRALLSGSGHRLALCVEVYGQNESGPVAVRTHVKGFTRATSRRGRKAVGGHPVGPRMPFCRVRIVGDDGRPVPAGSPGRITVRTPGTFSGYLDRPGIASRRFPTNRWWDTGDWGSISRLGRLTLIDRQVDRVTGAPSAIAAENVLLERFPELLELVVVDVDGTAWPVLSVRPGARFRRAEWDRVAPTVARLAEPVVIPDEAFPRTVTGKIKRDRIKDLVRRLTGDGAAVDS
ncbi:class I adenylate-forming enzyme family protein [Saccharothrix sp. NPDC042600]|uniref:class I adenylate-forming enzyme family protein n=1 Tax=Saccharothrix TaxID=2071 RepID=UPI0033C953FE|nr:AMP-binding protein [Saccharothrix mutabilis subsp. capreolus]